jgi:hypothetical protein
MNKIKQPPIPLPCRLCGVTSHSVIVQHGEGIGGFFITQMTDEERKEKARIYAATYYIKNKNKLRAQSAKWQAENKNKIKVQTAKYRDKNREKKKAIDTKYRSENPEKVKSFRDNHYEKRKKDPVYIMSKRLRCRLSLAFKNNGFKKQSSTEKMLGCSFKQFTKHIESQFTAGMSWDNRSEWHLDHIIPLSCATTIEGLEKLSNYTNIRPLWAADNLAKSDNLVLI